jgi:hypothetical protein
MAQDYYSPGDWFITDDRTGFKIRRSEAKKTWDGLLVDEKGFEQRHPQDFIPAVIDSQIVPDSRPVPPFKFVSVNEAIDKLKG